MAAGFTWLFVAIGGGLGALLRYWVGLLVGTTGLFPWATIIINIAGSFAIGWLWAFAGDSVWFQNWGRALLIIGLLGGFTTFSAFSLDVHTLQTTNQLLQAIAYVVVTVAGCLLGVWAGVRLGSL